MFQKLRGALGALGPHSDVMLAGALITAGLMGLSTILKKHIVLVGELGELYAAQQDQHSVLSGKLERAWRDYSILETKLATSKANGQNAPYPAPEDVRPLIAEEHQADTEHDSVA